MPITEQVFAIDPGELLQGVLEGEGLGALKLLPDDDLHARGNLGCGQRSLRETLGGVTRTSGRRMISGIVPGSCASATAAPNRSSPENRLMTRLRSQSRGLSLLASAVPLSHR